MYFELVKLYAHIVILFCIGTLLVITLDYFRYVLTEVKMNLAQGLVLFTVSLFMLVILLSSIIVSLSFILIHITHII